MHKTLTTTFLIVIGKFPLNGGNPAEILKVLTEGTESYLTPQIVAPAVISTSDRNEHTCVISNDYTSVYFTRDPERTTFVARVADGSLGPAKPTEFAGREAILSPDGQTMFFGRSGDIMRCHRSSDGWGSPEKLPASINTDAYEYYASVTNDGILYFSRMADRRAQIYSAKLTDEGEVQAVKVEAPINLEDSNSYHPFISPGGTFMIFNSDRAGGFGQADLYIAYQEADGSWSEPENLGGEINSEKRDICPTLTPDGKYLLFTRNHRSGERWFGDIYIVEAAFIRR